MSCSGVPGHLPDVWMSKMVRSKSSAKKFTWGGERELETSHHKRAKGFCQPAVVLPFEFHIPGLL